MTCRDRPLPSCVFPNLIDRARVCPTDFRLLASGTPTLLTIRATAESRRLASDLFMEAIVARPGTGPAPQSPSAIDSPVGWRFPSEGEGHTFESCRVRHFDAGLAEGYARSRSTCSSAQVCASKQSDQSCHQLRDARRPGNAVRVGASRVNGPQKTARPTATTRSQGGADRHSSDVTSSEARQKIRSADPAAFRHRSALRQLRITVANAYKIELISNRH